MHFHRLPIKLHDCDVHGVGSGAELFVVEGDSASRAVARTRRQSTQAVLPMQGKPLNAWKASQKSVAENALFAALIQSLGCGWGQSFEQADLRYDKVTLLFDPDADGIHCGALTLMFFYRWMRPLLESGTIGLIRPPVFELRCRCDGQRIHAYSEDHYRKLRVVLEEKQIKYHAQRYRGLASMNDATLVQTCIDPATRNRHRCTVKDAETAIKVFTGSVL